MKVLLAALAPYRKAVTTFCGMLAGGVGTSLLDGNLTSSEVLTVLGATMAFTFAAYRIPNAPKKD